MIDFTSTLKMALISLRINKMRSILTSLGIIIGVSAVIIMMAVGSGASQKISADISNMGSNLLMIRSSSTTSGGVRLGSGTKPTLTLKDAYAIEENCEGVLNVAPYTSQAKQVTFGNQNWATQIGGTTASYIATANWSIAYGRNISSDDVKNVTKVAVIGNTVAINLFGDLDPIGKTIRIGSVPFKIVGLLETKGQNSMGMDQDDIVLIPITTSEKKLFGAEFPGTVNRINVQAVTPEMLDTVQSEIESLLRVRHRTGKSGTDDFSVRNLTQMMETAKEAIKTMGLLLGAIASVSLLVGGIGIMNIMLVSVTERTKEIGIRMAIGAKSSDIRIQFLIESLLLSISGGIIGVLTGMSVSWFIDSFTEMTTAVSMFSIVLSMGFSCLIGVGFGYYPAYKASLLNPIDALRYE